MKLGVAIFVLIGFATLTFTPSHAYVLCNEPREPYWVDGNGYFDDEGQFNSCKSEVEDYLRDVKDYTQCLADEQTKTVQQSNQIVEKFNCRAAGKSYC